MKKLLVIIVSILLSVAAAAAKDVTASLNGGMAINPNWDPCINFGITGSTAFTDQITCEAEFFYYLKAHKNVDSPNFKFSSYAMDLNFYGHYFFDLKKSKIKPYASLGAGIFNTHFKSTITIWGNEEVDSWTKTKFNIGFGAGARYPLDKKSGIRVDARYIIVFDMDCNFFRITAGYYKTL